MVVKRKVDRPKELALPSRRWREKVAEHLKSWGPLSINVSKAELDNSIYKKGSSK